MLAIKWFFLTSFDPPSDRYCMNMIFGWMIASATKFDLFTVIQDTLKIGISLSHELGSERESAEERASEASSAEQANE